MVSLGPRARLVGRLLAVSRPFSWIDTALPFLFMAITLGSAASWLVVSGTCYFLLPYNLLMYGLNDIHDYESDRRNPRKGGIEGGLVPPALARPVWLAVAATTLPALGVFWMLGGPPVGFAFSVTALIAAAYSVPPVRTKEIPGLDSVTSALHFVLPAVCGAVAVGVGVHALPWRFLAAFFCWGCASHALGAIQDVAFDRRAGLRSIATALGPVGTALLSTAGYLVAVLLVATAGGIALVAAFAVVPYLLLATSCLGGDVRRARRAWRAFLAQNLFSGFALTMVFFVLWGVGPHGVASRIALGAAVLAIARAAVAVTWPGSPHRRFGRPGREVGVP